MDSFEKSDKSFNKGEKGKKRPGTDSMARVPKKVRFEKHCARSMGAGILCATLVIVVDSRRTERRSLISTLLRKVERKQIF